ncbi:hypothetical protein M413DRAFT_449914 [Hebeloma cylindrosporum]|uniref:Uncharacterized protein n=1 Tax=Hebeloma cylindrosporum TaxID=76867 RepID=A0A0C3BE03_HEBCY|nr:hypothetical protein M413DRAFT_449914 [Hebeloma cylindrosporum h7]
MDGAAGNDHILQPLKNHKPTSSCAKFDGISGPTIPPSIEVNVSKHRFCRDGA